MLIDFPDGLPEDVKTKGKKEKETKDEVKEKEEDAEDEDEENENEDDNAAAAKKDKQKPEVKKIKISLMLAQQYSDSIDPKGWYMSEKLDGVRCYWNGKGFYSRNGNIFYAAKFFKEAMPKDF